ncbi:regucalcin-like [Contarinia nasturtii]|uniref:regucalcin-like n=1 Tax=Contarinia nasturtii TaxID=265458 RepID=UPI0012D46023|nr:regucalcin-like [Contarinia nasturtii]
MNFVVSYEVIRLPPKWVHPYSLHYDIECNNLYFSDLLNQTINRFDLNDNQYYLASIEGDIAPSFIIPLEGQKNKFVISDKRTVSIIKWNGIDHTATVIRKLFTVETEEINANNNWNIAKVSPVTCRLYGGTFRGNLCSSEPGGFASLYSYSKLGGVKRLKSNFKISGGIDWNVAKRLFYHIDSCNLVIREYCWDPKSGKLSNGRIVYKFDNFGDSGLALLGMTIDKKGYLYAASYLGSDVLKINPRTSKLVERIKIPAEAVASVTFGGPNLDILFVSTDDRPFNITTGGISTRDISPLSGSIFMVKGLGSKGYPGRKLCIP